jgi:K+-transporting ATPase KdpF subunit
MISWDVILGAIVAVALTAYLIYAMLRAEKF